MSPVTMPRLMISGGTSGNPAGLSNPGQLELTYQNLLSGAADIVTGAGVKVLIMTAGAIGTASPVQIGNTLTAEEVAENLKVLAKIAAFCKANGVVVQVDANLTWYPTWSDGHNALVDQWAPAAASVGLPIAAVQDIQEIATAQSPTTFASYATIEANAVKTLIEDYSSSSYTMTASTLSVGDMEGAPPNMGTLSVWWDTYNGAAIAAGVPTFSYTTADTGWFAPWIGALSLPSWQGYLEALSTLAISHNMALDVVVQGAETSTSDDQFVQQTEQNAADLAMLVSKGSVLVSNIMIQSWDSLPIGVGMITSPTSSPNEAAEIGAVYPLYASGSITAQGSLTISVPSQIVQYIGVTQSIGLMSVHWDALDIQAGNRLGVVIIDQTGTLNATQHGSGTVSNPTSNILILSGNSADLAAELGSVRLTEPNAGPDTIDIETYGTIGRLSDSQISVLAAAPEQSVSGINATSESQGWISSSMSLNKGNVIVSGSVLTSETLYWNTTGTLAGTIVGTTTPGQSAFVKIDTVHEPLAEYGVKSDSSIVPGRTIVVDVYDPSVDNGVFPANGYANHRGINNVSFAPLPGWLPGSFNPATIFTPLVVQSTVKTFDPASGQLQESVDHLAPDPLTVVDLTGTHPDTFATAFDKGGTQVTEFNTPGNGAWQAAWGNRFSSATLTYDGSGRLVEAFLQGGPSNRLFTIDDVFNPNTGQLWEEFQSTTPPAKGPGTTNYVSTTNPYQPGFATGPLYVTEFNTGDNPNWDYYDWGNAIASDTEVWTDYFIMENFAGFAVNFPERYPGAMNAYPYQFVNGKALDLFYLPGTINVNLNALGTVTLESQTMISGFSGLNEIDAGGATGTVTITGLMTGGSTLIGGDNRSTITGYGHDSIVAGAGLTTINTGSGGSTVRITSAAGSTAVGGNNNVITAVAGSTLTLTGIGDTLSGSGVTLSATATGTSLAVIGNNDTVSVGPGGTVIETGTGDIVNYLHGGTLGQGSAISSATVNGNGVTVWMNANGGTVTAFGDNDVVTSGRNSIINLTGNHGVVGTWSGATVRVGGQTDTVIGSDITVVATTATTSVTVQGNSNTITGVAGSTVTLDGASDILNGSSVTVWTNAHNSTATVGGNNDIINATSGDTIYITGTFETVNGSNVTVVVGSYTSLTVNGANNTFRRVETGHNAVSVSDTAADVAANLNALEALAADGDLKTIILTDRGTPCLTLSAIQIVADANALTHISSPYVLDATTVAAVNATSIATLPRVAMVSVSDSATNIINNLGALETLAASGQLGSITFTDSAVPALALSAAQIVADGSALARIGSPYNLDANAAIAASIPAVSHGATVTVSDTAANVCANFNSLETLAASGQLGSITFTDSATPILALSAAQIAADASVITHIDSRFIIDPTAAEAIVYAGLSKLLTVNVSDTPADVGAHLNSLEKLCADGQLGSITFINSATPILTLTAMQLVADASTLTHISSPYNLDVTTATAANASSIAALSHVAMVSVSDTAANITTNLGALLTLVASGQLGSIIFTDSAVPTLALSAAQIATNGPVLARIGSPYHLNSVIPLDPNPAPASSPIQPPQYNMLCDNVATGVSTSVAADSYTGPVPGIEHQLIRITPDNLNIATTIPNAFIRTGSGNDAIDARNSSGREILDGSTGSNFLVGGSGNTTFFVDDRNAPGPIWDTIANLHEGDSATVWGVSEQDFTFRWVDDQGAAGYKGLTLNVTSPSDPNVASLTFSGYTTADLQSGNLSLGFGTTPDLSGLPGSQYLHISLAETTVPWVPHSVRPAAPVSLGGDPAEPRKPASGRRRRLGRDLAAYYSRLKQHMLENPSVLLEHEILEIILSNALAGRDIRPLARALIAKYRTLGRVVSAPASELSAVRGVGKEGVAALKLIQVAAAGVLRTEVDGAPLLSNWDQLIDYLSVSLSFEPIEHFHVLYLNARGGLIVDEVLSRGTVNHVVVYPREVVRRGLELCASAMIMVHNHPSGDLTPSREDVAMTEAVERAAAVMGISLHDHVIVSRFGYRSFRQEKLLGQH